ncbi:hypothetical protein [Blastococcus sp. LR1]|uniref:hypothetical protein n=1 Tax=Blastococcus sp. LR1 TaxID=2877000 RepID=UPI001CCB76F0|nr:hypothetical protein [Blastococcus sp. LR1]MCA0143519.1 hypothetical protein [Blastococcus sp. LR1]
MPPPGLTLMPEHGVDVPVWHGPDSQDSGNVTAEGLLALGVSSGLVERLRAWQEGWEHDPFTRSSPPQLRPGTPMTVRMARHLQAELPGYRIFLAVGSEPRPLDDWVGDRP